mmetsp:Transcript_95325/g.248249  ORF Transcript_95325/g.248249 Transcript_95325/m.248249 type:complete len:216 (-) Transcript_95325:711-1358(-)
MHAAPLLLLGRPVALENGGVVRLGRRLPAVRAGVRALHLAAPVLLRVGPACLPVGEAGVAVEQPLVAVEGQRRHRGAAQAFVLAAPRLLVQAPVRLELREAVEAVVGQLGGRVAPAILVVAAPLSLLDAPLLFEVIQAFAAVVGCLVYRSAASHRELLAAPGRLVRPPRRALALEAVVRQGGPGAALLEALAAPVPPVHGPVLRFDLVPAEAVER